MAAQNDKEKDFDREELSDLSNEFDNDPIQLYLRDITHTKLLNADE